MLLDKGAFCRDLWRFLDIIYLISYFSRFGSQNQFLEKTLYLSKYSHKSSLHAAFYHDKHV